MKKTSYLLSGFIALSSVQSAQGINRQDIKDIALPAGAAVVGTGLVVAGIYKLVSWLTREPSHQELLARVQNNIASVNREVTPAYNLIEQFSILAIPVVIDIHTMTEQMLAKMARHADIKRAQNSYVGWKLSIQKEQHILQNRITKLQKKKSLSYEESNFLRLMIEAETDSNNLLGKLDRLQAFYGEHSSYFDLHSLIIELTKNYEAVLHNPHDIVMLKQHIMRLKIDHRYSYPFARFINNLRSDMKSLERLYSDHYPVLTSQARYLHAQCNEMFNLLITSPEYEAEQRREEQDRLERQRIEALERQARAQEEQARAAHARVQAEREKAQALMAQAQAQAAQAHAQAQQAQAQIAHAQAQQAQAARAQVAQAQHQAQNQAPQHYQNPPPYNPEVMNADGTYK